MASSLSIAHATLDWKRQNPPKGPDFDWEMYRYVPSMAGAIVCLVIFLLMALLHLYQFLKSRNRIIVFVVIGALCTLYSPDDLSHTSGTPYAMSWNSANIRLQAKSAGTAHASLLTSTIKPGVHTSLKVY